MNFDREYDTEYLTNVIRYNRDRYNSFVNGLDFEINKEYEKVLNARYHKVSRIKRRLVYLLSRCDYVWFITFTFNDENLNKCERTQKDLMKTALKQLDFKYMINVDYGDKNNRKHFHCILGTNYNINVNELVQKTYKGGFSLSIQCKKGRDDLKRLSKYINKLTNHCIKATTKRQRMIYNFKGYDSFCSTSYEKFYFYTLDLINIERSPLT